MVTLLARRISVTRNNLYTGNHLENNSRQCSYAAMINAVMHSLPRHISCATMINAAIDIMLRQKNYAAMINAGIGSLLRQAGMQL